MRWLFSFHLKKCKLWKWLTHNRIHQHSQTIHNIFIVCAHSFPQSLTWINSVFVAVAVDKLNKIKLNNKSWRYVDTFSDDQWCSRTHDFFYLLICFHRILQLCYFNRYLNAHYRKFITSRPQSLWPERYRISASVLYQIPNFVLIHCLCNWWENVTKPTELVNKNKIIYGK